MKRPWRARIRERIALESRRALLRVIGREFRCASCGRPVFRGLPILWRGRVKLFVVTTQNVRVAFNATDSLEFRHIELDHCPSPERPWVR